MENTEARMRPNPMGDAYDVRKLLGTRGAIRPQQDATLTAETFRQHFEALAKNRPNAPTREQFPWKWEDADTSISHTPTVEVGIAAVRRMKNGKASGEDGLAVEMI